MRRNEAEYESDTHACQCQRAEVKDVFNRPLLVFVGGVVWLIIKNVTSLYFLIQLNLYINELKLNILYIKEDKA